MACRIANIDPQSDVALSLLKTAARDARPLSFADPAATMPLPKNPPLGGRDRYISAWIGKAPVGCGALREVDAATAEIQRLYVHRDHRRRRVGRTILAHLEEEAARLGYLRLLLETGDLQTAAMALYEASGYRRTPTFGKPVEDPNRVWYEKHIARTQKSFPGSARQKKPPGP